MNTRVKSQKSKVGRRVNPWLVAAFVLLALLLATAVLLAALQPGDYRLENLIDKARSEEMRSLLATATWSK